MSTGCRRPCGWSPSIPTPNTTGPSCTARGRGGSCQAGAYVLADLKPYRIQVVNSPSMVTLAEPMPRVSTTRTGATSCLSAHRRRARRRGRHPDVGSQRQLDLTLLYAMHPAYAQILGLYHVDETTVPGTAYDYLLLADYGAKFADSAAARLRYWPPRRPRTARWPSTEAWEWGPTCHCRRRGTSGRTTCPPAAPPRSTAGQRDGNAGLTWAAPNPASGPYSLTGRSSSMSGEPVRDVHAGARPTSPTTSSTCSPPASLCWWAAPTSSPSASVRAIPDGRRRRPTSSTGRSTTVGTLPRARDRHLRAAQPAERERDLAPVGTRSSPRPWWYDDAAGDGPVALPGATYAIHVLDTVPHRRRRAWRRSLSISPTRGCSGTRPSTPGSRHCRGREGRPRWQGRRPAVALDVDEGAAGQAPDTKEFRATSTAGTPTPGRAASRWYRRGRRTWSSPDIVARRPPRRRLAGSQLAVGRSGTAWSGARRPWRGPCRAHRRNTGTTSSIGAVRVEAARRSSRRRDPVRSGDGRLDDPHPAVGYRDAG